MHQLSRAAMALSLGIACALPAFAQTATPSATSAPSSTVDPAGVAYGVPPSTSTPSAGVEASTGSGAPAAAATAAPVAPVASPAQAADTSSMANATPSAPSISADAVGTSTPPATQAMGAGPETPDRIGGGPDVGWLGLLGLLGLFGLRRKHPDVDARRTHTVQPAR